MLWSIERTNYVTELALIDLRPHWALALLALGLPLTDAVQARVAASACPHSGLSGYTARSYATEKGASLRCALLAEIERDGELAAGELRARVTDELARRFALHIDFAGEVDLSRKAVDYLLSNMPETAALVSAYSDNDYRATQTDIPDGPDHFFVTNNDTFAAGFTYLFSRLRPGTSEHIFLESGFAKVLFWRVWGSSFIHYRLHENGEAAARYDIRVHVFTDSRLLRTVLSSGPFSYFAQKMFDGILEDIEMAVDSFALDPVPGETLPPYFVTGLKKRLGTSHEVDPREDRIRSQYRGEDQ